VGTYNHLVVTTGHLSAQMSSGQDEVVGCSNTSACIHAAHCSSTCVGHEDDDSNQPGYPLLGELTHEGAHGITDRVLKVYKITFHARDVVSSDPGLAIPFDHLPHASTC
jgi:hypothetical protein